jgi:DNA-binding PadR family transcriptional regulator
MLAEQPMHGYELITALEERSGGRWKPSPGSIYPALRRLEFRELISSTETDGKRRFELTDAGRQRVAEQQEAGNENPWDSHGLGGHGELRRAIAELTGPARQIGRFGTPEQVTAAVAAVKTATSSLYRILADGSTATDDDQVDAVDDNTVDDNTVDDNTD